MKNFVTLWRLGVFVASLCAFEPLKTKNLGRLPRFFSLINPTFSNSRLLKIFNVTFYI